jgi:glycosyltransferase involved in cell wall biosynthesis
MELDKVNVSALVSAYYSDQYIETRLFNLKKQDCEIIVICQAGSYEEEVGKQYGVKVITTPDIPTIYAAWNLGIHHATGEYLTSANTDDLFYPGALSKMVTELERTGAGICHSQIDIKSGNAIEHWKRVTGGLDKLKRWCFVGPMPVWRTSLHWKHGLFDETFTIAGDYEFWLRCVTRGESLCYIDEPLGLYLTRRDSLEHRDPVKHLEERKRIKLRYG